MSAVPESGAGRGALDGRRIVVTGGASGIAASAVRAFVAEGALVASLDVTDDAGAAVVAGANERGPGRAWFHHCDVSSRSEVTAVFAAAVAQLGGLDALVHAAGVLQTCAPEEITDEQWERTMAVHARGTFLTNQCAFPHLRDGGGGRIVNFSSGAGIRGIPSLADYSAAKGAILGWTRAVAVAWAKHGITVNAVAPAMHTEASERRLGQLGPEEREAHQARLLASIPMGRMGDPDEDLAPVLVFLVGDGARYITGQTICVDGGLVILS